MIVEHLGQKLELRRERALYWHDQRTLALSDLHLGKAESYQREGIPIPADAGVQDLTRLSEVIHELEPETVLFVGDLIHARNSWSLSLKDELEGFFHVHHKRKFYLIIGNHERGSIAQFEKMPVEIVTELTIGSFMFTHGHHQDDTKLFSVEGHFHPMVTLREGPLRVRLPCFVLNKQRLILPSFGQWTGGAEIGNERSQRIFAVSRSSVFEV